MAETTHGSRAEHPARLRGVGCLALLLLACEQRPPPEPTSRALPRATVAPIAEPPRAAAPANSEAPPASPQKQETVAEAAEFVRRYQDSEPQSYRLGELSDVAPAGPATATPDGVVMTTLAGDLVRGSWHDDGVVEPIERDKAEFAPYGRGPALSGGYGYWIRKRHLLRRKLRGQSAPEVLASDAREGTRVAAEQVGKAGKSVVGYIAESEDRLYARLWLEGGTTVDLSPDGSQATSVNLVPSDDDLLAVVLEGRTSMSPVHARRLLLRGKVPQIQEDVVVWVGPPSQPLSEIVSLPGNAGGARSFLALERTVTDFGLASFGIKKEPQMDANVAWLDYPNGINPAPVAAGSACGKSVVLFARPSESRPRSPQELSIAKLEGDKLGAGEVVARSRAFNNISIAPVKGGALLVWTADFRTWARTIFCK